MLVLLANKHSAQLDVGMPRIAEGLIKTWIAVFQIGRGAEASGEIEAGEAQALSACQRVALVIPDQQVPVMRIAMVKIGRAGVKR